MLRINKTRIYHFPFLLMLYIFNDINHIYPKYIDQRANRPSFISNAVITPSMIQGDINRAVTLTADIITRAADITKTNPRNQCRSW